MFILKILSLFKKATRNSLPLFFETYFPFFHFYENQIIIIDFIFYLNEENSLFYYSFFQDVIYSLQKENPSSSSFILMLHLTRDKELYSRMLRSYFT